MHRICVNTGELILFIAFVTGMILTVTLCVGSCSVYAGENNIGDDIMDGAHPLDLGPKEARTGVLMVHGFVGTVNNFENFPYRIAEEGYHVRAMRLPGHGTKPSDMKSVTADSLYEAVRDEYRAMRTRHERVAVIGHSMGGTLATILASQEEVDAIVLCAPFYRVTRKWYYVLPPEWWSAVLSPLIRWVPKSQMAIQVNRPGVSDKIVSYRWIPIQGVKTLFELERRATAEITPAGIRGPILIIHARGDDAASYDAARDMFRRISSHDKRFVTLERSNHVIFWDYERDDVTREIISFLHNLQ